MDCRKVDVGVIGERNEMTISSGGVPSATDACGGMAYDRLVVDASNVAPRYVQNETL